jgi:SAM-dependent methyltransferase
MTILEDIRAYWDQDAHTYDDAAHHRPRSPGVQAAWLASLASLLPDPPVRVLDCGAGTGFLSLMAARLGHRVTALDVSGAMLDRLRGAAESEGLSVEVVQGPAERPDGTYDVVMERHLLWTLQHPSEALEAWRAVAPQGRLVTIASLRGSSDPLEQLRAFVRGTLSSIRGDAPHHHAEYPPDLRDALPLAGGVAPDTLIELVRAAGWRSPRMWRLRDVEWAETLALGLPDRLLGVAPRYAVVAEA